MRLAERLDQNLLIYLDERYGHLRPFPAFNRPTAFFRGIPDPHQIEHIDRLQRLTTPAFPPLIMRRSSIPYRERPERFLIDDVIEVRSMGTLLTSVSFHPSNLHVPLPDPYERDPTNHPGFSHLPKRTRFAYSIIGSVRSLGFLISAKTFANSKFMTWLPVTFLLLGLVVAFGSFDAGTLSDPSHANQSPQETAATSPSSPSSTQPASPKSAGRRSKGDVRSPSPNRSRQPSERLTNRSDGAVNSGQAKSNRRQQSNPRTSNPSSYSQNLYQALKAEINLSRLETLRTALLYFPARFPIPDGPRSVSSEFGLRLHPIQEDSSYHGGVDLPASRGTPILPPARGTVAKVGQDSVSGRFVRISHAPLDMTSSFSHLNRAAVKEGQKISLSDTIGTIGQTGRTTGPHLHYRVEDRGQPVNPADIYERFIALRDSFQAQLERSGAILARSLSDEGVPRSVKDRLTRLENRLRRLSRVPARARGRQ